MIDIVLHNLGVSLLENVVLDLNLKASEACIYLEVISYISSN